MTAPKGVTSATGIDALCHAIEAYTSRLAQPLSDTFALSAVKRIFNNLTNAYEHGDNEEAGSRYRWRRWKPGDRPSTIPR